METYGIFLELAIIVITSKIFGLLAKKLKAPQVVGQIVAGILIGPSVLGIVSLTDFLKQMAEIGVILLMFSAGLETNLRDLKKTGLKATLIACCGVFIPLICGSLLYMAFYGPASFGSEKFLKAVFIGVILTATSVSITVQALKEMGRLKGEIGTTIVSAAIIDDVIGIIVLTVVVGFKNPESKPLKVILSTIMFFAFALIVGVVLYKIMKALDGKYPHTRRIPIMGLAICFSFAYIAEAVFGVADITGAYLAGIILCSLKDSEYIARKTDINSYMLFGPIFFASIGLNTNLDSIDMNIILFTVAFVVVGLLSKIIGCGLMAKALKYKTKDCIKIGVGMMTRGEVALIVSQKGRSVGLVGEAYFTAVIVLIVVSSILTPIILKLLYKGEPDDTVKAVEATGTGDAGKAAT